MAAKNYMVRELCPCGNEARHTTINDTRRCGVCIAVSDLASVSDDRVAELLKVLVEASDPKHSAMSVGLRTQLRAIIGRPAA